MNVPEGPGHRSNDGAGNAIPEDPGHRSGASTGNALIADAWRPIAGGLLGLLGATAGIGAAALLLARPDPAGLGAAALLHLVGAGSCGLAARLRHPRDRVQPLLVLLVALLIPGFGPLLAGWLLRRPRRSDTALQAHLQSLGGADTLPIARPARIDPCERAPIGLRELLRHGSLDHRRNALRTLARLGQPHHLALLRSCLGSDDAEIRLGAFAELDRLQRRAEAERKTLEAAVLAMPDTGRARADALLALALAHQQAATSGLADAESARRHVRLWRQRAAEAFALWPSATTATALAMADSALGRHDAAAALLDGLPWAEARLPPVAVARATIAFRRRDFGLATRLCGDLRTRRLQPPAWLAAFTARRTSPTAAVTP